MPVLSFTSGNDSYEVTAADTYDLSFLAGDDVLTLRSGGATTTADMGDDDDTIFHRAGIATVLGGSGSDRFEVYASGLTGDGGADNDLFNVRAGTGLNLAGGLGDDRFNFYGATSAIMVHGNDGADDFIGYNWAISGSIYGDADNDYFVLFRGSSVSLYGGAGNDIFRADATSPATFVEAAGEGTDSVQVARGASYTLPVNIENITVSGFSGSTTGAATLVGNGLGNVINGHANAETIHGLEGNDKLFGKGGDDLIFGGDGDDIVDGGDGTDTLYGDGGNDTINGRAGSDHMVGGAGNDLYYVDSPGDLITESADSGTDTLRISISFYALAPNVERGIQIGTADLSLTGNELDNELIGNSGDSVLHGLAGNDILRGGLGADILDAGDGDDLLYGGSGADMLSGGSGSDIFKFTAVSDSPLGGADFIAGFDTDMIDLSGIDADVTADGNQAFFWSPAGPAGALWLVNEPDGGTSIYGDVDGDNVADFYLSISQFSVVETSAVIL